MRDKYSFRIIIDTIGLMAKIIFILNFNR